MKTENKPKTSYNGVGSSFDDYAKKRGTYEKGLARALAEIETDKKAYENRGLVRIKHFITKPIAFFRHRHHTRAE
jgi:hypothetical protein